MQEERPRKVCPFIFRALLALTHVLNFEGGGCECLLINVMKFEVLIKILYGEGTSEFILRT